MNFKRIYRVMSIAMLVTCIGQVSFPLASKTTEYVAKEVSGLLPETVYTKSDLLASKKDTIYKDTIENEENNTLKYEIVFNEFATSKADVKINKKSYDLNSDNYSGKSIEGKTENNIDYSTDASNIDEDVIKSLKVTKMPNKIVSLKRDTINQEEEASTEETTPPVTPDTGKIEAEDDTATPDTGMIEAEDDTATPDTGMIEAEDDTVTPDTGMIEAEDDTVDAETYSTPGTHIGSGASMTPVTKADEDNLGNITTPSGLEVNTDGGESGKNQLALAANDTVVVYRNSGFDGCHETGVFDYNGNPEYTCAIKNASVLPNPIKGAPDGTKTGSEYNTSFVTDLIDYMNIQARDSRGKSITVDAGNLSITDVDATTNSYAADYNNFINVKNEAKEKLLNDNTIGTHDNFADDSNASLSPLVNTGIATYNFNIKLDYDGKSQEVKSSMTVVDPFYLTESDYFTTNSIDDSDHMYGNAWKSEVIDSIISAGISLDMVLDVQYDQTSGDDSSSVDIIDEDGTAPGSTGNPVDALTDEGESAYTLGFGFDPDIIQYPNKLENADNISGYQLNIPRGSEDVRDGEMNADLLNKYFNKFELTVGRGADSEYDATFDTNGAVATSSTHELQGYAGKAYDNNTDEYSYSESSTCIRHTYQLFLTGGGHRVYRDPSPDTECSNEPAGPAGSIPSEGQMNAPINTSDDAKAQNNFCNVFYQCTGPDSPEYKYYWSGDGSVNQGDSTNDTIAPDSIAPYYGYRKTDNAYFSDELEVDKENFDASNSDGTMLKDDLAPTNTIAPGSGVYVVDDGDYDNEVPGVYNVVLGYTTEGTEGSNLWKDLTTTCNNGGAGAGTCDGIENIGQEDVYMLLPVNVYEPPRIAADDTEVWQSFAPKSEADLKDAMDVEALWLRELTNEGAKEYNEENYCKEAYGPAGIGADCLNPDEDTQHYVNNMYDEVQVTSSPKYNYANPQVGSYLFTFYIDGINGVPRTLDEGDIQRQAVLYVKHDWDDIHNADLHGTTPVAVETGTNWYDLLDKMDLALVESENGTIEYADQDITPEEITIREYGGWQSSSTSSDDNPGAIMVLEAVYQGLEIEGIFEVQTNWKAEPWEASDEISMSVNTPLTVPVGNFDPVISPNAHAYDKNGDEVDVDVDFNRVSENIITGDHSLQVGLVGNKLIQGNYYAQNYKVVDVSVIEVEDSDMVKLAVTDANSKGAFSADNEDDFKELMDVKALNAIGEDITDNVEVYSTGDYVYGDTKTNGEPYEITFGVVDDTTGITFIDTADYYVIGNSEPVPDVTLKGTSPVYVHTGDDIDEDDIVDLLNGAIELDINNQFKDLFDEDLEIVSNDGYDPNDEDTYYVEVSGVYDEPKSDIDLLEAEAIFQVIVDDNVETSSQITFEGTEDLHIDKGADFDELEGVKATSKTDGDITKDIEVKTNTVDVNKDGVYEVDYYVSDSTGAYATVEREVAVGTATLEDEEDKDKDEDNTDKDNTNETNGNNKDNTNNNSDSDDNLLTQVNKDGSDELTNTATTARTLMYLVVFGMMSISYVFISKKIFR